MRITVVSAVLLCGVAPVAAQRGGDPGAVWQHLAERYDADGDGVITAEEHGRGERQFRNLDRDGDGTITAADFERRGRRPGRGARGERGERPAPREVARRLGDLFGSFLNVDGEPGLSAVDWQQLRERLAPDENGVVGDGGVAAVLGLDGKTRMARMGGSLKPLLDHDGDGELHVDDLDAVFAALDRDGDGLIEQGDEIDMPPGVGEMAPDFSLPFAGDADRELRLSSHRGERPVVLIFGSYT